MTEYTALPSLINDNGVMREFNRETDGKILLDKLKRICEDFEIRFITAADCPDMPEMENDTIFYSSRLKVLFVSDTVTDKTVQVAIEYLLKGGVVND